jgi:hypothetical protein
VRDRESEISQHAWFNLDNTVIRIDVIIGPDMVCHICQRVVVLIATRIVDSQSAAVRCVVCCLLVLLDVRAGSAASSLVDLYTFVFVVAAMCVVRASLFVCVVCAQHVCVYLMVP